MDNLQIQHALDQVELHASQLKELLLSGNFPNEEREELEERIQELENELSEMEDKKNDAESENDDLKDNIKKAKEILEDIISEDAGHDYAVERINEIMEIL